MLSKKFILFSILSLFLIPFYSFGSIKVDVNPQVILFDSTDVGDKSDPEIITVKNTGSDKFYIVDIGLTGNDEDFEIINEDCEGSVLNGGEECTIEVVFAPESKGTKAAALDIKMIGDGIKTEEVGLTGIATLGGLLEISPSKHDFGSVDKGDSKSYVFTLKNKSDENIQVKEIKLELDDDNFKLNLNGGSNPCGSAIFTLNPSDSCTIEISFEPDSKGVKTSTLSVKYELDGTELYSRDRATDSLMVE
ncbi:MAG: choice-of-anchor D domain-containing protein [Desulfobacula sp.]|nr:choice-of-anchor D domain-containing protein [Desulfobacula sp.]